MAWISKPENYAECLNEIRPRMEFDPLEKELFEDLELPVEKRKRSSKKLIAELKTHTIAKNKKTSTVIEEWLAKCDSDIQKGYISSVPMMYSKRKKMPTLAEFLNDEAGDLLRCYNQFLVQKVRF